MARTKIQLQVPEVSRIIEQRYKKEKTGWRKQRLLVILLASEGKYSSTEIAKLSGFSRGYVFELLKKVRKKGLNALFDKSKAGRPQGWRKGIPPEVTRQFKAKLANNEFITLVDACRWLEKEYGIKAHYNKVRYWAKKVGGVLRRPRPSHSKQDPKAAEEFKQTLTTQLEALGLKQGTRAKVWVMDESRFGLHTLLRRVWGIKGNPRAVVPMQIKYQWDYLYGALEVSEGEAHFCQINTINLDCDRLYLENLSASDPEAVHIVIRDQAGFHLRDGDGRLPENVRIINLPPYSPELNPCEQLWDIIKDGLGNRVYESIEELRASMKEALKGWWEEKERVLSLVGRP